MDCSNRQTMTASPAEPGGLPLTLGIVGAIILNLILRWIGIYAEQAWLPQLFVGAAGAAILIWGYRAIKSR